MKVILTGKNSYIAVNTCQFLLSKGIEAECISVREGADAVDFNGADAVIHCAAIVHKREDEYADEYDYVNFRLAADLAEKAKRQGVSQFVLISTMAVYGITVGVVDRGTPLKPKGLYGISKLKAERYILSLKDDNFNITVVRPPMVYGKNCPGNYGRLSKIAKLTPLIPDTKNRKSLIYIENLAYALYKIISEKMNGIFMPMDGEYVSTADIMGRISKKPKSVLFGRLMEALPLSSIKKAFGTLYYDKDIAWKIDYINIDEAVRRSEE